MSSICRLIADTLFISVNDSGLMTPSSFTTVGLPHCTKSSSEIMRRDTFFTLDYFVVELNNSLMLPNELMTLVAS